MLVSREEGSVNNRPKLATSALQANTCDHAFALTLSELLEKGHGLRTFPKDQPGKASGSAEIIGFQIQIDNPRDRVLKNPKRLLNPVSAVARFVWMVAGSDRLEDIAYYENKVRDYTDNSLSVPGSNYGMRLFQPRPGLNQIEGVIDRLKSDAGSRRTAAVIWTGEDAVRESRDIPCAFGVFYHAREGQLVATTIMRSNNAYGLMPYNTFEFGLLAELIATSAELELGPLIHYAASMHLFDNVREVARETVNTYHRELASKPPQPMPPMPRDPPPLKQAYELARLEAQLRHDHANLHGQNHHALKSRAVDRLDPYWLALYRVLLSQALIRAKRLDVARIVCQELPEYFRFGVAHQIEQAIQNRDGTPKERQLTFADPALGQPQSGHFAVAEAFAPTVEEERQALTQLDAILDDVEKTFSRTVSRAEANEIRKRLIYDRPKAVAARSESEGPTGPGDRQRLSQSEVTSVLNEIRRISGSK